MSLERRVTPEKITEYESIVRREELQPETRQKYLTDVWKLEEYLAGEELTQEKLYAYPAWLMEEKKYKKRSVNAIVVSTRKFCQSMGWTELEIGSVTLDNSERKSMNRYISREEYKRLVEVAMEVKKYWLAMLIQTLCHMDIRYSELSHLTVDRIRKEEVEVIRRHKQVAIDIPDELAEELLVYAVQEGISEGIIFRTSKGTLPDRSNVWKEIKELCRTAGLENTQINMQKFRMPLVVDYYPYYPMENREV